MTNFQKLTSISPAGSLLAVGSTDDSVTILRLPSLETAVATFKTNGGELVDLCWGGADGNWVRENDTGTMEE